MSELEQTISTENPENISEAVTESELAAVAPAPVAEEIPRQRIRVIYEKGELVKFISHQDEFRLWERTLRRADLPLLYKQGFNPQPHIQFASPLGVGITGAREPIDITFSPPVPLEELEAKIVAKLTPGVFLREISEVPLHTPALQGLLIGADYTILIYAERHELESSVIDQAIDKVLAQSEIWRERQRKGEQYTYNLRPLIFELKNLGYDAEREEHRIALRVQQRNGATGRPDEVVAALGLDDHARTLRRDRLYYADQPEDVALFDQYPLITQAEIAGPSQKRKDARRKERTPRPAPVAQTPAGRSISERAGDEFA